MLFPDEDLPHLKKWIVKRLENTSDADADVLADYVLALLRHDGDVVTVRALCEREMPDFLKEDSTVFVRDVFDVINYKSYLPGAPPPPRRPSIPFAPPSGPSASAPAYGGLGNSAPPIGPMNGSRKRSYNDRGEGDIQRGFNGGGDPNGRSYKQPRRGGPGMGRGGGGFDPTAGRGGFGNRPPPPMNFPNMPMPPAGFPGMPPMPSPPVGMPPGMPFFDPREGFEGLSAMLAMGLPMSVLQGIPQGDSTPPRQVTPQKERCRDYDVKGFCARGNTCPYEHGQHSIWVPPTQQKSDEYDPTTSLMSTLEANTNRGGFNGFRGGDRGRGRGGQRGNFNAPSGRGGGRGGRSEFSSNAPNYDKNNTTIVVEQIPEDNFTEEAVRGYFSEFGNIVDVSMRPYKRLAIVKFDDWNSANAAYKSPKVIFDNRFVKVYWFVDQESLLKPPAATGTNGVSVKKENSTSGTPAPAVKQDPEIDLEEFAKKQAEAQKTHEEKLKKKAEMEAAKKELEKRQEELLKSQAEEKRKLMERIAAKSGKSASPIKSENGTAAPSATKSSSQTEALKAQLAALEAEAKSLGIDPNASTEDTWDYASFRGRGRGRGGYRGRGTFPARAGIRGGYRSRGGVPFSASGRSFNLDNRTKKVGLTGVDFTDAKKDESLREYLFGIGEYTEIETAPNRTVITFKDRFTAESFMKTPNSEIPSVGKVDMAWIQTPLPPVTLQTTSTPTPKQSISATTIKVDEDTNMDEGDAMASSPANGGGEGGVVAGGEEQHIGGGNYDYDVAGEDEWN
ncbi:uncharacterized protein PAC_12250 [Phialocephala subalpina]|uniref:RNA-binding protein n=1 Tax=Phialocephala subalpina TaxID=576137 RepID=A0A1L7XBF6_9HELO|nr:uncharacterized protein PAC_12250 [Phialocephala subalpina]